MDLEDIRLVIEQSKPRIEVLKRYCGDQFIATHAAHVINTLITPFYGYVAIDVKTPSLGPELKSLEPNKEALESYLTLLENHSIYRTMELGVKNDLAPCFPNLSDMGGNMPQYVKEVKARLEIADRLGEQFPGKDFN